MAFLLILIFFNISIGRSQQFPVYRTTNRANYIFLTQLWHQPVSRWGSNKSPEKEEAAAKGCHQGFPFIVHVKLIFWIGFNRRRLWQLRRWLRLLSCLQGASRHWLEQFQVQQFSIEFVWSRQSACWIGTIQDQSLSYW